MSDNVMSNNLPDPQGADLNATNPSTTSTAPDGGVTPPVAPDGYVPIEQYKALEAQRTAIAKEKNFYAKAAKAIQALPDEVRSQFLENPRAFIPQTPQPPDGDYTDPLDAIGKVFDERLQAFQRQQQAQIAAVQQYSEFVNNHPEVVQNPELLEAIATFGDMRGVNNFEDAYILYKTYTGFAPQPTPQLATMPGQPQPTILTQSAGGTSAPALNINEILANWDKQPQEIRDKVLRGEIG